jgi:hypothetical protein
MIEFTFKDVSTKNSEPTYWTILFVMPKMYFIYKVELYFFLKSTWCEYILKKILSTSEVGSILARIAPSPLMSNGCMNKYINETLCDWQTVSLLLTTPNVWYMHPFDIKGLGAIRAKIDPTSDVDKIFFKMNSHYVLFRKKYS